MRLLTEMDQPGSRVDRYVSQLSYLLSRKAAGIVNLQTRLARFQRHLKEQEVMSQHRWWYEWQILNKMFFTLSFVFVFQEDKRFFLKRFM